MSTEKLMFHFWINPPNYNLSQAKWLTQGHRSRNGHGHSSFFFTFTFTMGVANSADAIHYYTHGTAPVQNQSPACCPT